MRTNRHVNWGLIIAGLVTSGSATHAGLYMWNGFGNQTWNQPTSWLPGGFPGPSDTVSFSDASPFSTVYLGGNEIVDTLDFSNSSAHSYLFSPGTPAAPTGSNTLTVNKISRGATTKPTSAATNTLAANVTLTGPTASAMSVDLQNSTLTLQGALVATGGVNLTSGTLILGNSGSHANSATINMNGGTLIATTGKGLANVNVNLNSNTLYLENNTGGTSPTSVVSIGDGQAGTLTTFASQLPPLNILGGQIYPAWNLQTLTMGNNSQVTFTNEGYQNIAFSQVNLNGPATVYVGGAQYFSVTGSTASLGSITESVAGSSLLVTGGGRVAITGASNYTGGTVIGDSGDPGNPYTHPAFVDAQADGALGSGPVTVNTDSAVQFSAQQTHLPTVTVAAYGGIGGNLSGASYGTNVILANNAVLFPTAGPVPANLSNYWRGVDDATGSYTVGGGGYKGAAFGTYTAYPFDAGSSDSGFIGSISETNPGEGIAIYTSGFLPIGSQGGKQPTFNTTNTATGVTFTFGNSSANGSPEIAWFSAPAGTARTFTFFGAANTGYYQFTAENPNVIPAGYTVNINQGQFWSPYYGIAVSNGATVNINATGSLYLTVPTLTGTFHVLSHGTMFINSPSTAPGNGATFQFDPGAQLELEYANIPTPSWLPTTADLTVQGANTLGNSTDSANITLDSGRHIVGVGYNGSLSGENIAGSGTLVVGAVNNQTLTINNNISIPGGTLQIGDTGGYLFHDYINPASNVALGGTVVLTGQINVGTFSLASGSLQLGAGASVTINQDTVGAGSKITGSGIVHAATLLVYGTVSPGDPASFTNVGNTTLEPGGSYDWQIESTTGKPGTDWDLWKTTGILTISSTSANPFVINLESLASNGLLGQLGGFNPADNYSWEIMSVGGLPGFDPSDFTVNTSEFADSFTGTWSVSATRGDGGDEILLNYSVPEPVCMSFLVATPLLIGRRRKS